MATLNIDIEKATKKIYEETHDTGSDILARRSAEQLKNYHPDLFPIIEAWLNGEELEFEFKGVSLSYIITKEKTNYFSAMSRMSTLMENPDGVERYKNRVFRWK